jgi:hypothetical protein
MSFASRLVLSGIFLAIFVFGFADYQSLHPWPSTFVMYTCFLATALVGLFLCTAPRSSH